MNYATDVSDSFVKAYVRLTLLVLCLIIVFAHHFGQSFAQKIQSQKAQFYAIPVSLNNRQANFSITKKEKNYIQ